MFDALPVTSSARTFERAQAVLPGGNTRSTVYLSPHPVYAAYGSGCRVWDLDGNALIDCINNFTAMIHGYIYEPVMQAVREQLLIGTSFGMPTVSEIELAELLCERLPAVEQVRFANSGTEAVMIAIKAARAFTGRSKIMKIEGAYHGSYDYAEVSLDSSPLEWGNSPASIAYAKGTPRGVLDDVVVLPFNDIEAARSSLDIHGKDLAAVLIDPLPNRAGLIPAKSEYLRAVVDAVHKVGALVIFDEVISLRLGYSGAQGLWGIAPDLTTMGKIIGGGFPVGAIGGRRDVMAVFDPRSGKPALPHGGTFSANPVTMRAGLAAMAGLKPEVFNRLAEMGERVRGDVNGAFRRHGIPGQCVGMGSLFKVHFVDRPITDYRSIYPDAGSRKKLDVFHKALLAGGILSASYGLFALSTPMTDADIDDIIAAIDQAIVATATA